MRKKVVVLTGAGISAESGITTFRDAGGLWEGHSIEEVATPQGFAKNPELVLDFYNQRRRQLHEVKPNKAHFDLAALEADFDVTIITQNVDDLHERAGSTRIIHLHGELKKAQSTQNPGLILDWPGDLVLGDRCPEGSQLRPFIVWFGEAVPKMAEAEAVTRKCDAFLVVGTSLLVYPAAGLIYQAPRHSLKYLVDPNTPEVSGVTGLVSIAKPATKGVSVVIKDLVQKLA